MSLYSIDTQSHAYGFTNNTTHLLISTGSWDLQTKKKVAGIGQHTKGHTIVTNSKKKIDI